MSINVTFEVCFQDKSCANEDELQNNLKLYLPKFNNLERLMLEGFVTVEGDWQKKVVILDDLYSIVNNLLFPIIIKACSEEEGCLGYRYFTQPSHLAILYYPESIQIFGDDDYVPSESFSQAEILPAFYQCGQRFIDLLQRLRDAGGARFYEPNLPDPVKIEKAKEALLARSWLSK